MNLASWVLVGGAAGIVAGVLFGDACAMLRPVGFAYVGLLDLFTALSQNYVSAAVIFCIFYGVAMQTLEDKTSILSVLNAIRLASLRFWNWIVRLAPVGVFALFAVTAGTTPLAGLVNMSLYIGLFLFGTFLLAFWMLPALIAALAPVGHREVLSELRAAVAISAVTTLSAPRCRSSRTPRASWPTAVASRTPSGTT